MESELLKTVVSQGYGLHFGRKHWSGSILHANRTFCQNKLNKMPQYEYNFSFTFGSFKILVVIN